MPEMRVIEMREPGGPDVLVLGSRPIPEPGPGEVLIKITAAGVNGPDLVQRRGHYPPPKGATDLLGLEVSGEITALGGEVTDWAIGDRVCALTNGGGYAECVAVNARHCLSLPQSIDPIDAAGLPETFFTVWSNVFHGYDIPKGANFLIHGGAGGIGSTAVQLGKAFGLNVFTTVGSAADADFVTGLGADRAIVFQSEDFVGIVREAGGSDITLDIIGGDYIARNIKSARHDGRIIQIAFNAGSRVEIDLMPMMLKRLHITGSTLRSRPEAFKNAVAKELHEQVWPLFATSQLKAVTHAVLPLEDAAEAHKMMEAAQHRGKILLKL
ncbi:MAG: NAD(P)H-quinone oxidoreductase [Pseudomonadota bacterium]